mmetsp:Transcript_36834/g.97371  ORF Transcript_36834/g.97371 Transcript_36834/m.97371 type:complete len:197 (-) Transcript_36834:888-1478(-)
MLALVTKDREKLRERLAAETEHRKRLEAEKREMERKLRLGSATTQLETRKGRSVAEELTRKKDELSGLKQVIQTQTIEITKLLGANTDKEKRLLDMEKKMGQYDVRASLHAPAPHSLSVERPAHLPALTPCLAASPCTRRTPFTPWRLATCATGQRWRRWARPRLVRRRSGPSTDSCSSRCTSARLRSARSFAGMR